MLLKKSIWLKLLLAILLIMTLAGCAQIKQELGLEDKKTVEKNFKAGVPFAYKGYYGRGGKQNFQALELQNDKFIVNKNKFHNIQYQQLDQNTYLIRGKNNKPRWHYFKMDFKIKNDTKKLGLYHNPSRKSELNFDDTRNLAKDDLTWYRSYELDDYNLLTGKTKVPAPKVVNLDTDYFQNKIFISNKKQTHFLSFMADPDSDDDDKSITLYNVSKNGRPSKISTLKDPQLSIKDSKLEIKTDIKNVDAKKNFYKEQDPSLTFQIISKTKLKDKKSDQTYTLFDGNYNDTIYTIADQFGYPTNYVTESDDQEQTNQIE